MLVDSRAEGSLLGNSAINAHLQELGLPKKSILSINRCGKPSYDDKGRDYYVLKSCACGSEFIPLTHKCNNRACPTCSKIRKGRILNDYLPVLSGVHNDRNRFNFKFLTISPDNYQSFSEGDKHLRESLKKFMRTKYFESKVKGGLYVLETKYNEKTGWNIHVHMIAYSTYLDNRIRGKCNACNQNLLRYDKNKSAFFCASSKCGSYDVQRKGDSKLVRLFRKASGTDVNIDIKRQLGTTRKVLQYMLKYVGANKDDFHDDRHLAEYIVGIHKKRLISKFGIFHKTKVEKQPCTCYKCGEDISFSFDSEVSKLASDPLGLLDTGPPRL